MSTSNPQAFFIPDRFIQAALDIQLECCRAALAAYERIPARQRTSDERAMRASLKRDLKAYQTAGDYWRDGLRPSVLDGVWSIASRSQAGLVHHIVRDRDTVTGWRCDCWQSCGAFHVHDAIMTLIEVALDLMANEGYDDPVDDPPPQLPEPTPTGPADTTTTTTTDLELPTVEQITAPWSERAAADLRAAIPGIVAAALAEVLPPITFDDGTPIPDEPDPVLEEVDPEPWLPQVRALVNKLTTARRERWAA